MFMNVKITEYSTFIHKAQFVNAYQLSLAHTKIDRPVAHRQKQTGVSGGVRDMVREGWCGCVDG